MEKPSLRNRINEGARSALRILARDNRKCLVCGRPIRYTDNTGNQIVLYHPECREFRHNRGRAKK